MLSASRFILFTSSVEPSLQPLSEAWAQLGEAQSGQPMLHGLVDTAEDQHLADRFRITDVPTILLFRDRKVMLPPRIASLERLTITLNMQGTSC